MREILFKAKRIDNGEWVEGSLVYDNETERHYIVTERDLYWGMCCRGEFDGNFTAIKNKTICQYTGLTDKNGNKIWENDVCRYVNSDECGTQEEIFVVKYGRHAEFCKINMGFYIDWIKTDYYRCDLVFWTENRNIQVIGNIFDNPELIKECD